LFKTIGIDVA